MKVGQMMTFPGEEESEEPLYISAEMVESWLDPGITERLRKRDLQKHSSGGLINDELQYLKLLTAILVKKLGGEVEISEEDLQGKISMERSRDIVSGNLIFSVAKEVKED